MATTIPEVQDTWFEIPRRTCSAEGIFQVGQVLRSAQDPNTTIFQNGPFRGMKASDLSHKIRVGGSFEVEYPEVEVIELTTSHSTVVDGARIDDKGNPVRWQLIETESISSTNALLQAILREKEVGRYLARESFPSDLFLVVKVQKVQEIIPSTMGYDPGPPQPPSITRGLVIPRIGAPRPLSPYSGYSAARSASDGYIPASASALGFDGLKNGKPFIWKYELERIRRSDDIDAVFSERYLPRDVLYDAQRSNWIRLVFGYLFRWMLLLHFPSHNGGLDPSKGNDSDETLSRPRTLVWRREIDDPVRTAADVSNSKPINFTAHGDYWPPPPPPHPVALRPQYHPTSSDGVVIRNNRNSASRINGRRKAEYTAPYIVYHSTRKIRTEVGHFGPNRPTRRGSEGELSLDSSEAESAIVPDFPGIRRRRVHTEPTETAPMLATPIVIDNIEDTATGGHESSVNALSTYSEMVEEAVIQNEETPSQSVVVNSRQHPGHEMKIALNNISSSPAVPTVSTAGAVAANSVASESGISAEYDVFDCEAGNLASALSDSRNGEPEADKFFNEYINRVNVFMDELRGGRPDERPKIAVLDTGLDMKHPLLQNYWGNKQISEQNSLDFTKEPNTPVRSDSTGHGTHCTHLILKICKTAQIYTAKVFKKAKADQATAECIAKAINHAVNTWKVDIISMSFSFNETQQPIKDAIDKVHRAGKPILFLAAASNYRLNEPNPVGFPARHKGVIRVNSSQAGDMRSTFSPKTESDSGGPNFSILGEHLNAAFPPKFNAGNYEKRQSGTSMATAVLAGVAGLVIEFSRLRAVPDNVERRERLLTADGMKAVFRKMLNEDNLPDSKTSRYLHVKPWILLRDHKRNNPNYLVYEIEKALGGRK